MEEVRPHLGTIKEDEQDGGTEAPLSGKNSPNNSNEESKQEIKDGRQTQPKHVGISPKINTSNITETTSPRLTEQLQFEASLDQQQKGDRGTQPIPFGSISGMDTSEYSRITGAKDLRKAAIQGSEASANNDAHLMLFLQDQSEQGVYLCDMGKMDDTERSHLIIDKDTQLVYDSRREIDLLKLEQQASTGLINKMAEMSGGDLSIGSIGGKSSPVSKTKPWGNLWKKKKQNNLDYLMEAETGNLEGMKDLLDPAKQELQFADLNTKGPENWGALHFAANEGHEHVTVELIQRGIELESRSTLERTPLHLAAARGHANICSLLIEQMMVDRNCIDIDENTPLHLASEQGHGLAITYLIKEARCDHTRKNKYGYLAGDIAYNTQVRQLIQNLISSMGHESRALMEENKNYNRREFNGVLLHNDRVTQLKHLMHKFGQVEKHLEHKNHNEEKLVERLEAEEEKKQAQGAEEIKIEEEQKVADTDSRWKNKFITIWKLNEQLQRESAENEAWVGPKNFKAIMKLGQGSFGIVYLVEKLRIDAQGEQQKTGKFFAMKILNKKQILGQNLVKYAKTERDVLTYTAHPFIVGLKYAFQTPEKLFLLLDYAPGGNMSRALQKDKRFTETKARYYLAEVLLALEDLHRRDIIFRDLKPDNIVFDKDGHALLTDFGLSKVGVLNNTQARSFCGSPAYLAPEMLRRQGHGKSVDWYLLGVLLYEMLVGIPPYYSNNKDQLYSNIQTGPLQLPKFLSDESRSLLIALLNRNPQKRLGSGPRDSEEIKEHAFFAAGKIKWEEVRQKRLPVPEPYVKKILVQEIPIDKVYGRGAFDENLRDLNRVNEWSYVRNCRQP